MQLHPRRLHFRHLNPFRPSQEIPSTRSTSSNGFLQTCCSRSGLRLQRLRAKFCGIHCLDGFLVPGLCGWQLLSNVSLLLPHFCTIAQPRSPASTTTVLMQLIAWLLRIWARHKDSRTVSPGPCHIIYRLDWQKEYQSEVRFYPPERAFRSIKIENCSHIASDSEKMRSTVEMNLS
jgi:hypothetical protein